MHAISFSLSFTHDIAGYILCSFELNMQAMFMYMYNICVCALFRHFFFCPCSSHPYVCGCVLQCVSTVACLEAAELWMLVGVMQFSPELEETLGNETLWGSRVIGKVMITVGGQNNSLTLFILKWLLLCLRVSRTILSIDYMPQQ